jgi:hypothetical protein
MAGHENRFDQIVGTAPVDDDVGDRLGSSRDGRAIRGFRFGTGPVRVSVIAGCHADEPVGPRLLRHLAAYLESCPDDNPLLTDFDWWIVPHINPDGEHANRHWQEQAYERFRIGTYLEHVQRELPGDDVEFGFPRDAGDTGARPETQCVYEWWVTNRSAFALHVTLHGIAFAAGPWYLLEEAWIARTVSFRERCASRTRRLGYQLHDVERNGEKGFRRIERGFCTRPDSMAMRQYFLDLGDEETAEKFRPSSMEAIRSLGGDPLTLVSEMPLFITPGVGETRGPPDTVAKAWKDRIATWRARLGNGVGPLAIDDEAESSGLIPMPIRDQMTLQWDMIVAGLESVTGEGGAGGP